MDDLEKVYQEMAKDEERELKAEEWAEGLIVDWFDFEEEDFSGWLKAKRTMQNS